MMTTRFLLAGFALAACSTTSSTQTDVTRDQYDDTAQAIATATVTGSGGGDIGSMSDSITIALGTPPLGFVLQGDGHFHGNRLGIDYSYAITCKDAAGTTLALCDATTDAADVSVAWSGNLRSPNLDADVSRTGDWTLTGLQGATATFDGDSSFSLDTTLRSVFRPGVTETYMFDLDASYDAVKVATANRLAIGGTATLDVTGHHKVTGSNQDVDASFSVHATVSFTTIHTALIVIDGTQRYSVDLATGVVVRIND
jgi:hypothetical protein